MNEDPGHHWGQSAWAGRTEQVLRGGAGTRQGCRNQLRGPSALGSQRARCYLPWQLLEMVLELLHLILYTTEG